MMINELELIEEIGCGGTGVVYRARQSTLGRLVAVKLLRTPALPSAREVQALREEAELIARLDHPNIVPVYGVGEDEGRPYLVMKLIEGEDLGRWRARRAGDFEAIGRIMAAVAGAVQHAHERGVLHRDLKPGNILVDNAGEPHVVDFGLSRRLQESCSISSTSTVLGTFGYASPEQATGSKTLGPTSDVYSLGAILYELLTGRVPLEGPTPYKTLLLIQEREPDPPRAHDRRVDLALEAVCLKCLQKDPKRRYQSAAELELDLRRWLAGTRVLAERPGRFAFLTRFSRNRLHPLAGVAWRPALGLLALALVAVLTATWFIIPEFEAARLRKSFHKFEADMKEAKIAFHDGNYSRAREIVEKYTFTGSLALDGISTGGDGFGHRDRTTLGELQSNLEWVTAHGFVCTLTVPLGIREARWRIVCWSVDGKRIVTGWGTVCDSRSGELLEEGIESRDRLRALGIELDEDPKWTLTVEEIKRVCEKSGLSILPGRPTWGRMSPDGKQIITYGGYGYYNVWDLSKWDVELDFPRRTIKEEPLPPEPRRGTKDKKSRPDPSQ